MVPDAPDHQLGHRVESKLGRLAREHVGDAGEDVGCRHGGEVLLEGEEGHRVRRLDSRPQALRVLVHALHAVDDGVVRDADGRERLGEGDAHVLVVARVQHELHLALGHVRAERLDELAHESLLRARAADGDEDAARLARARALLPKLAVELDVVDEVLRDPVAGEDEPVGRDSHPEEVVVVGRALDEVVRAGHDDEPLRIVVDHEVDDMLEAEGDGEHPHKAVRRDDGRGAGDRLHERPQVLRHLVKHAQRVLVAVLGDHAPQLLDRAPELCRHTRAFRVELVHVDDQLGFGRVDVEQVVEVRRPPRAERPRRRRVRDAVVAESHPDCADDDRLGRRLEAGRAGARSRL
mmetsp:Transcript_26484/g.78336  ORF Transcript_26484/g.78336 Transcript_26484/m.78336 type:complete len:350 (-) Transcript_26484:389-1438(-)